MNRRILTIVLSALLLSVCASYLVYRAVAVRVVTAKPLPSVQLFVAARDLAPGAVIRSEDLKAAAWTGPVPSGAVIKRDTLLNRGVSAAIYEGEPVTENRLSPKGSGGGLAATIPPGMRACAVKVNSVVGDAGFVVPGMRVDVLVTGMPPGANSTDGARVRTLLQNIEVLSAGTNFQKDQQSKPEQAEVVNLLVTPEQAEILSLAGNETHIQLVLRNPVDTEISKTPGTGVSDLFGRPTRSTYEEPIPGPRLLGPAAAASPRLTMPLAPVPPASPQPATPYTIQVSNGAAHSEAKFSREPDKQ